MHSTERKNTGEKMKDPYENKRQAIEDNRDYVAEEDTISLLDLIAVLVKRRKLIIGMTLAGALLIVGISILTIKLPPDSKWNILPNIYEPKVEVLVKGTTGGSSISQLLSSSSGLGALAGLVGLSGSSNTSAELAMALLEGNTIKDQIAEEFNFVKRYHIEKYPKTTARKIIQSALETDYDSKTNILTIGYKNIDPVFATKVLNRIVKLLEKRFKDLTLEKVRIKKQFLEERLKTVGKDLKKAQDALVSFQRKYGIVDIEAQAQEQIKLIADLTSQVYDKELQLQTMRSYLKANDPKIVRLKNEINKMNTLIMELRRGFKEFSGEAIPQEELPMVSAQYLNLKRDLTIQETIYTMLRQQYETAKLEETDTSQTFQILENAEIPEVKAAPSRSKICVIFTITVFFLAIFLAFVLEYFERVKKDPVESVKLREIQSMIKKRKKE